MAIDFHDLTAITDTLKYVYGSGITNQFADEHVTYNQFPTSERKPRGLGYEFGIRFARAQGTGARKESARLPDPLVGKFGKAKILPKYIYGSIRLTGPMIEAAKSDVAAFVDGLADSTDDIYQSIVTDLNRQAWGDGFGKVGTVSAAATYDTDAAVSVYFDNDMAVRYLRPGMMLDFFKSTGLKPTPTANTKKKRITAVRIKSVHPSDKKIIIETGPGTTYLSHHPISGIAATSRASTTLALASGAIAVKMGARYTTMVATGTGTKGFNSAASIEMMGLLGIYDDDTLLSKFENIDTGSYPDWQANVLSNSSVNRELSIDLMLQAVDLTRIEGGQYPTVMRMGLGQRRKYANLLMPDVRFQPTVLKGGYETLTFAGGDGTVEIVVDPMAQPNKIFFEPRGTIQKFEMSALGWGNLDQQMHQRANYDEWDMFMRLYTNLGVEKRSGLVLLDDLVEPSIY